MSTVSSVTISSGRSVVTRGQGVPSDDVARIVFEVLEESECAPNDTGVLLASYGEWMQFVGWEDGSILEAASWRLASELSRRHPSTTRLIRAHPGGGQSDCLWLLPAASEKGDVRLNRNGTIQVLERFDGRPAEWESTTWDVYFRADPAAFLLRLEAAAGLPVPSQVSAATPRTLTLRVLAAIAATGVKSVHPVEIRPGMIDTSGYGGGKNREAFDWFAIPTELLDVQDDDFLNLPEYRFWFVYRDCVPVLAFEQERALAWTRRSQISWPVMRVYEESRRNVLVTALKILHRVDDA